MLRRIPIKWRSYPVRIYFALRNIIIIIIIVIIIILFIIIVIIIIIIIFIINVKDTVFST